MKDSVKKIIGENIRAERQKRGMSLDDLSNIIGVTSGFMGLVERGHRGTDVSKLVQIAKVFETSLDSLMTDRKTGALSVAEAGFEPIEAKRAAVYTMAYDLSLAELDFVNSVIKELKNMREAQ